MMKSELEISMERFVLIFRLFLFFVDIQFHDFLAMKKRVLYFMYLILYSKAMIYSNCWFSVHFNILLPVWLNIPNHNWLLIQGFLWPTEFFCWWRESCWFLCGLAGLAGGQLSEVLKWLDKPLWWIISNLWLYYTCINQADIE